MNWGQPLGQGLRTQEVISFLGSLCSFICMTCPAQRKIFLAIRASMEASPRRCISVAVEILWALVWRRVTLHIARMHLAWKVLSLLSNFSVKHHNSDPYNNTVSTSTVYTSFFACGDTLWQEKTPLRNAPKAAPAFSIRFSTSRSSFPSLAIYDPR